MTLPTDVQVRYGRLTSRWIGPGMRGEFGVIVVCSGRGGGRAAVGPGRSARRR